MELKDFVTDILSQIAQGISEAQKRASEAGATSSPICTANITVEPSRLTDPKNRNVVQEIHFDVVLGQNEEAEDKPGFAVAFSAIGVGAAGRKQHAPSHETRVTFSIRVAPASKGIEKREIRKCPPFPRVR